MAAAKEHAAKVSAAHARAEADQASFLEREKVAAEKRRQENQNRRVMDSERERNSQRKLNAATGREWDVTKQEDDYNPRGGRSQYRRGMHGAVTGQTRRESDKQVSEPVRAQNNGHGRGRGERPNWAEEPPTTKPPTAPKIDRESDFPSLPGGKKEEKPAGPSPQPDKSESKSPGPQGTWADQVEENGE